MPDSDSPVCRIDPEEFALIYRSLRGYVEDISDVLDSAPLSSADRAELLDEKKSAHRLSRKIREFLLSCGIDVNEA